MTRDEKNLIKYINLIRSIGRNKFEINGATQIESDFFKKGLYEGLKLAALKLADELDSVASDQKDHMFEEDRWWNNNYYNNTDEE